MKIILQPTRLLACCLLVAAILGGCASSSLQEIHDTYQSEFQGQLSAVSSDPRSDFNAQKFPATLSSINSFRQKHASLDEANKHLTVLEALVYLQSGRYGQARLAASTANGMPGSLTLYGGGLSRDELLLKSMNEEPGLIDGWKMLASPAGASIDDFDLAAQQLQDISSSDDSRAANGDDGRIYLAAVSAMLWRKAAMMKILAGADHDVTKNAYGAKMTAALDPHLRPHEKDASAADANELAGWALRYRYVRLYLIGKDWSNL
jgi:hypothetical protein